MIDLARFARTGLRGVGARDHPHPAVGGLDEVDAARPALRELQRSALDGGGRERVVLDRDHRVAARRERTDAAVGIHVQADARAPAGAVRALDLRPVAGGVDPDAGGLDAAEALERVGQDVELQRALVREFDVTEVGATGSQLRRHGHVGLPPDVRAAVRRRVEHLEHLAAPEGLLPDVGEADAHALPGDRVGHEHDAPAPARLVGRVAHAPDEHTAVGDAGHIEVEFVSGIHPPSIPQPGRTRLP